MEKKPNDQDQARKRPGVERVYRNDRIAVYWEPSLCIHVANCIRGNPQVFDPGRHPWVDVDAADAERIAEIVKTCPTGALHFELLDGEVRDVDQVPISIEPRQNGPLYIRGPVEIIGRKGKIIRKDVRLALCRCGHSDNKPFCDGTHREIEFKTPVDER